MRDQKKFCPTLSTPILSFLHWYMMQVEHIKKLAQVNPGILRKIHFCVQQVKQKELNFYTLPKIMTLPISAKQIKFVDNIL